MKPSRVFVVFLLAAALGLGVAGIGPLPFTTTARSEVTAGAYTVSNVRGALVVSRGRAKIQAYAIEDGKPPWASGLEE